VLVPKPKSPIQINFANKCEIYLWSANFLYTNTGVKNSTVVDIVINQAHATTTKTKHEIDTTGQSKTVKCVKVFESSLVTRKFSGYVCSIISK